MGGETTGRGARLSEAEHRAWCGLLQGHARVARRLEVALQEHHHLSLAEHDVLERLWEAGGRLRMSELAGTAHLSPSGISRLVDRLAAHGLLERATATGDGRAILAVITTAGRRRLQESGETYAGELREAFLSDFSADEVETLGKLLGRLRE
ncbi:MAG: MarR family transcriptional regulator [Candidatus Dormibacteraeota bacterium]|nr:MarR family transcriptional regulator [Candidatus Dormibacteraeota bacterium]